MQRLATWWDKCPEYRLPLAAAGHPGLGAIAAETRFFSGWNKSPQMRTADLNHSGYEEQGTDALVNHGAAPVKMRPLT
ncbi:hypothetical protein NDU88_004111 [Pleurodeles waltl]|uniref:Uncharacterized protein n=1 Tax=Pleurodeles waltl TaxID=8319 RepID=A0AAV7UFY2_PLEWA|nr:hypothetical protein NDU88_004111 [Pleurodeles waltl]